MFGLGAPVGLGVGQESGHLVCFGLADSALSPTEVGLDLWLPGQQLTSCRHTHIHKLLACSFKGQVSNHTVVYKGDCVLLQLATSLLHPVLGASLWQSQASMLESAISSHAYMHQENACMMQM